MTRPHWLFVTGKLAEPALRRVAEGVAIQADFDHSVAVLPITVIALATADWIARHLELAPGVTRILLPGLCQGDVAAIATCAGLPVERGPEDLLDLPEFFGAVGSARQLSGASDIEIIAEINHCPRLSLKDIVKAAAAYRAAGADVIDLGCDPGGPWSAVGECVHVLRAEGHRVSIDSFNPAEVGAAVAAGAELVLSVNGTNRGQAPAWGCEVVAIPDTPVDLDSLDRTAEFLAAGGVRFRLDPVVEPIGVGFAQSLGRFLETRRRHPDAEILMGVGNLTELTDVDSAGINVLLAGFCQELGIRSVLTTQVVNWCRTAVRELDLARRLVYHSCRERVLPKHLAPELVMLRDPKLREHGDRDLRELARRISDPNVRLFAERGRLIAMSAGLFLEGADPFELFGRLAPHQPIDPAHAFYLGFEMAKAATALALGKNYVQDRPLRWGMIDTAPTEEPSRITAEDPTPA